MGFLNREVWKDINGYEGLYEVSNKGKIRSRKRKGSKGGELNPSVNSAGYYQVGLSKNGVVTIKRVHRLVAEAFCKKPKTSEPLDVHHKNDKKLNNKLNNHASNLEWIPESEHMSMEHRGHTRTQGEKSGMAKLTDAHAREILEEVKTPYRGQINDLAKKYGVSKQTISAIKTGRIWKHLKRNKK